MSRLLPAILGCFALTHCGPAVVSLETDQFTYSNFATGPALVLALKNNSTSAVFFGLCTARLERNTSAGWTVVGATASVCTLEGNQLNPGSSRSRVMHLPPNSLDGAYKFVATDHFNAAEISSNEFDLR